MIEGKEPPLAGKLDMVCEEFGCTPGEAVELDEELTMAVLQARHARRAMYARERDSAKMTTRQTNIYKAMLDALDARDRARGIPEEL